MRKSSLRGSFLTLMACGVVAAGMIARTEARARERSAAQQAEAGGVLIDADDIGGVVTSSKGPEAGVWVIAETTDFQTKMRKIVVTDDAGRFLLPQLPKATYKIWVRGYGLVDSKPVHSTPGKTLALTAVIAPNALAAAQYYPGDYWYSLLNIPPKSAFPLKDSETKSQAEYVFYVKRGCGVCHQPRHIRFSFLGLGAPDYVRSRRLSYGRRNEQVRARSWLGNVCRLEYADRKGRGTAGAAAAAGYRAQRGHHAMGGRYGHVIHP